MGRVVKIGALLLLGLVWTDCIFAADASQTRNLDSLLLALRDRDQAVRREVLRLSQQSPSPVDSLLSAYARMQEVDAGNQRMVAGLLEEGWPEEISDEAGEALWLVIDHADLEMQRRFMPLVEEQVKAGRLAKSSYATLLDRMLMRENRPQRYGTQTRSFTRIVEGDSVCGQRVCYVWPVEHPASLDSLRAAMGLIPIGEYLQAVEETYGGRCIWNPELTVEQLEALLIAGIGVLEENLQKNEGLSVDFRFRSESSAIFVS